MRKGGGESGLATAKWRFLLCPRRAQPGGSLQKLGVIPSGQGTGSQKVLFRANVSLGIQGHFGEGKRLPTQSCMWHSPSGQKFRVSTSGVGQLQDLRQGENHHLLMCWFVNLPGSSHYGPLSCAFCICQGLQSCETPSYLKSCRAG